MPTFQMFFPQGTTPSLRTVSSGKVSVLYISLSSLFQKADDIPDVEPINTYVNL